MNTTVNSGETYVVNSDNTVHNNADDLESLVNSAPLTSAARSEYNELIVDMLKLESDLHVYKIATGSLLFICIILFTTVLYLLQ